MAAVEPPAILYHFTGLRHMRGIALYGLTIGDVPIDDDEMLVGVSLTTAVTPANHGLSPMKTAYRLSIDTTRLDPTRLHKWTAWAPRHVKPQMLRGLHKAVPPFARGGFTSGAFRRRRSSPSLTCRLAVRCRAGAIGRRRPTIIRRYRRMMKRARHGPSNFCTTYAW
jgi:hypothetical protein